MLDMIASFIKMKRYDMMCNIIYLISIDKKIFSD